MRLKRGFAALLLFIIPLPVLLAASTVAWTDGYMNTDAAQVFLNENWQPETVSETELSFWEDTRINLITISKGTALYQWFGHTAIEVMTPGSEPVTFNYGYFSFGNGFYGNFIMGRLLYNCLGTWSDYEIRRAAYEGRTMTRTELLLSPEKKKAVVSFLNFNATPPNNTYLYHYYLDNCATRVRDIIDIATNGQFRRWAHAQKGLTFRQQDSRIFANSLPVHWFLDFLQGPAIDNSDATLWEEMYLPSVLQQAVLDFPGLAGEVTYVTDFRQTDTRKPDFETPQDYTLTVLLISLAVSVLLVILGRANRTVYGIVCFAISLILGIAGSILFFMMFFTTHDVTWMNENIILCNPLFLVTAVLSLRSRRHEKGLARLWLIHCLSCVLLLLGKLMLPGILIQQNMAQILTFLPLSLSGVWVFRGALTSLFSGAAGRRRKSRK